MYAHFKKLLYFSTECLYAPFAARGLARTYIKARPAPLAGQARANVALPFSA